MPLEDTTSTRPLAYPSTPTIITHQFRLSQSIGLIDTILFHLADERPPLTDAQRDSMRTLLLTVVAELTVLRMELAAS